MIIRLSERSGKVLAEAYKTARSYSIDYIGTEYLLKVFWWKRQGRSNSEQV